MAAFLKSLWKLVGAIDLWLGLLVADQTELHLAESVLDMTTFSECFQQGIPECGSSQPSLSSTGS